MAAASFFHVGQRLTDYQGVDVLVERAASGGFGAVAMGPDRANDGRWWAIKVLRPDLLAQAGVEDGPEAQARLRSLFLREALTWVGLWPHSNLLGAQFVTHIDDQLMLVLDYAESGSLRDRFDASRRRGSWLTVGTALFLAQQIAAGLVALHTPTPDLLRDFPIVHRDLKPENILLDNGRAMITDFGLAKAVAEALAPDAQGAVAPLDAADTVTFGAPETMASVVASRTQAYQTQRGVALGTPAYMAPEQWLDASQAQEPADVYAFGLLLAELLTSRHPLLNLEQPHRLADWRRAHLEGTPIPLRRLGADVFATQRDALPATTTPAQLDEALAQAERLLERLLAKRTTDRPTMGAALEALQAAVAPLGEQPYTPQVFPPTRERTRIFWHSWAETYTRFGLFEGALPRVERALAMDQANPGTLNLYGTTLMELGRAGEAVEVCRQALAATPTDDARGRKIILNEMGLALTLLARFAEAEEVYAQAVAALPEDASNSWANRAVNEWEWAGAEARTGRVAEARAHGERGLAYIAQAAKLNPSGALSPRLQRIAYLLRQLLDGLG